MSESSNASHQTVLAEKLSDSLSKDLPELTARSVPGSIQLPGKATAVIGMRRAGKTTFLHQMRRQKLEAGIPRERLPYINFEDERLAGLAAAQLNPLLEDYYRRFPELRGQETVVWCFDEIQLVAGWESFVRRVLDTEKVEIFVTGSSAALLSREIATALRGRAWEVLIHPFGFGEVLRHAAQPLPAQLDAPGAAERSAIERALLGYLEGGGFPEAQGLDVATRHQMLRDYVDVAILRDVVERHNVSNVAGLRWLVRHLLGNAGSRFSVEKFYAALKSQGLSISKDTMHQLLAHLQDCFLVRTVWMESNSERQRMVNPRKAYPVDSGLIPIFDRTGHANLGHALETVVLLELERRRYEVTYVRTKEGFEVDFLARGPAEDSTLIQVCADASDPPTAERDVRALAAAGREHPRASKLLLTLMQDGLPPEMPADITVMPAWMWLLS